MTILLDDEKVLSEKLPFDDNDVIHRAIGMVLENEGFPDNAEISVTYTDEDDIREINKETRNIDAPTDVLSFPMISYVHGYGYENALDETIDYNPETDDILLGDIVLCIPRVIAQAEEYGHSVLREFAFLVVHSMLHLSGYDHIKAEEMSVMEDRQRDIMTKLQISRKEML